jgi:hypothetical protein
MMSDYYPYLLYWEWKFVKLPYSSNINTSDKKIHNLKLLIYFSFVSYFMTSKGSQNRPQRMEV